MSEIDFIALPKVELHAHLSGSISRQCLHEIWSRKKNEGKCDLDDPLMAIPSRKGEVNLQTFFPIFGNYIYHLVSDPPSIRYATLSVLRDFEADGVVYLELRTTPRACGDLDRAGYVEVVQAAIAEYEESTTTTRSRKKMHTKLLLSVDRRDSPEQALETVELAIRFRSVREVGASTSRVGTATATANNVVVGVDLCGDPRRTPPGGGGIGVLGPAMRRAREAGGLGLTVHFAEAEESSSRAELDEMLAWRPDRLGHVVCVPADVRSRLCEDDEWGEDGETTSPLGLELCISCNVQAGMIKGGGGGIQDHHFGEWWSVDRRKRPRISLATDDVGIFESPLSEEYRLVARYFGLSRQQVIELARESIAVIFGGEEEKQRLRNIMWQ